MKVVFIAEQFVPPVFNGSTLVYDVWLRMLSQFDEVFGIFFSAEGEPTAETHTELRRLCRDYLILPGHARSRKLRLTTTPPGVRPQQWPSRGQGCRAGLPWRGWPSSS